MNQPPETPRDTIRDLPELLADLASELRKLFMTELALAKAEMSESARSAAQGIGMIVAAALVTLIAVQTLVVAAVIGLAQAGLGWLAATLIVGGVLVLAALIFAMLARKRLSGNALKPKRTAEQIRKDLSLTEEMTHG
ncbi:phage holin family protein [Primorskyibacter sp. 2E107]|uniref:phage holin family protein n=1 Tax=Primorskyibacter sp. 2E107 TaxID=3403458 RepID=UPI003AF76DEB